MTHINRRDTLDAIFIAASIAFAKIAQKCRFHSRFTPNAIYIDAVWPEVTYTRPAKDASILPHGFVLHAH